MADKKSPSQMAIDDISALLRARVSLIWIVTKEEQRVERFLTEAAQVNDFVPVCWDVADGFTDPFTGVAKSGDKFEGREDANAALLAIKQFSLDENPATSDNPKRHLWMMRDLPIYLEGAYGAPVCRRLRNLARSLPEVELDRGQAIVVLSPSKNIPVELSGHVSVIDWPLPDRDEVSDLLEASMDTLSDTDKRRARLDAKNREAVVEAAVGLTGEEAVSSFALSLVQHGKVEQGVVAKEKRRVIARDGLLKWHDPMPGGLDSVGGLEKAKAWLKNRAVAYDPEAREYGLPLIRGIMLPGVPGCGKSLLAKCVATAFAVPLLSLDLGALKNELVGRSEANLRRAISIIEAIGRCVVLLDEVEKSLQGATSNSSDGGVSADALGTLLKWMNDREGGAMVIATANDVTRLPPELTRSGRFDKSFFVDLPNAVERVAVLKAALVQHKRQRLVLDLEEVAKHCENFSGAEIANIIPEAMFMAYADKKRQIRDDDLIAAAKATSPMYDTQRNKIEALRTWAKDNKVERASADIELVSKPVAKRRQLQLSN